MDIFSGLGKMRTEEETQQLRNSTVLNRLLKMNEDQDWVDTIANALDVGLDDVASDDGFGTERQMDPRGDCRDEDYSMYNVEGVD